MFGMRATSPRKATHAVYVIGGRVLCEEITRKGLGGMLPSITTAAGHRVLATRIEAWLR